MHCVRGGGALALCEFFVHFFQKKIVFLLSKKKKFFNFVKNFFLLRDLKSGCTV